MSGQQVFGLVATTLDHVTDKHFEKGYDKVREKISGNSSRSAPPRNTSSSPEPRGGGDDYYYDRDRPPSAAAVTPPHPSNLASPNSPSGPGSQRRYRNHLPSPEREYDPYPPQSDLSSARRQQQQRPSSLERQSETSEKVLREYENERDDPSRRVESVLPDYSQRSRNMSNANGYGNDGYAASRPRSQPPRSRYDDDEGSDYDEREGRRYRAGTSRGYDDDRDYDREIIETERYRGPARPYDPRRLDSSDAPYGSGTLAPYRRSQNDVTEVSRRSNSRGRRDRYDRDDDRDRSYSRSRSRSRSGGIKEKIEDIFDTSGQGLGVGLAGAVVGGLAGRQFGGPRTKNRDIVIGALIGGLGANAAENKYREWKENRREREDRYERDDRYYEKPYDGRARSSVR